MAHEPANPRLPSTETVILLQTHVPQNRLPCSVEGCDRPRLARGACNIHYYRARRAYLRQQREATSGSSA